MSLTPQQRGLLDTVLRAEFTLHLPPLLKPKNPAADADKNMSRAFAGFAISALCEINAKDAAMSVVDDFDDFGVDAIYYHAASETLYLVQAKLKAAAMFSQEEANAFVQGVRKLIQQDFSGFNAHITARQLAIEDAMESCSKIELIVAHVGAGLSHHAGVALDQLLQDETHGEERLGTTVIEVDGSRVVSILQQGQAYARIDATVVLRSCASRTEGRKTYIGFIPIVDLVRLHQAYGKALYAKNIRQHLGHTTNVNIAIRGTLSDRPGEFEYLNNGVTVLADRIDPKDSRKAGKRLSLTGMSVINGAQTVASSARFVEQNAGASIDAAMVPITIIQADHDVDFSKRVTRARNHQNPVLQQNFAALDDEQERLRRELALLGVHYAYKAEAIDGVADPNRIRIDEAAQALAVAQTDPRFPVYLKNEPGQLLLVESQTYKALFTSGLTAYRLLNAVRVSRYVQGRLISEVAGATGYEKLTYRHGGFALSFILAKRLEGVLAGALPINGAKLDLALSQAFDGARQSLWTAVQTRTMYKGPLAVFRNIGETLHVLQGAMIDHYELATDPVLSHKTAKIGEPYPLELFDYLASKAPQIGNVT